MGAYSTNKIFTDSNVNALLDRLYYEVATALPEVNFDTKLCLTGRAAAQLQGAAAVPCKNLVLLTSDAGVFTFAGGSLPKKMNATGAIRMQARIIFYLPALVLELWYQPGIIKIETVSGIKCQDILEINEILL